MKTCLSLFAYQCRKQEDVVTNSWLVCLSAIDDLDDYHFAYAAASEHLELMPRDFHYFLLKLHGYTTILCCCGDRPLFQRNSPLLSLSSKPSQMNHIPTAVGGIVRNFVSKY
jgi:hypothetical protein